MSNELIIVKQLPIIEEHLRALASEIDKRVTDAKSLLALCGKKQVDMAASFGMSKQTMGNKMNRGSWSANDLAKAAEFCGCKLAFIMPDGQQIIIDVEEKEKAPGE